MGAFKRWLDDFNLSGRHIQLIALGGSIGTGLFIGSGQNLATGGPGSLMLGFIIVAVCVILTMVSLGELAAVLPVSGSFCTYSVRFLDPSWGFAMGWNYWLGGYCRHNCYIILG